MTKPRGTRLGRFSKRTPKLKKTGPISTVSRIMAKMQKGSEGSGLTSK